MKQTANKFRWTPRGGKGYLKLGKNQHYPPGAIIVLTPDVKAKFDIDKDFSGRFDAVDDDEKVTSPIAPDDIKRVIVRKKKAEKK